MKKQKKIILLIIILILIGIVVTIYINNKILNNKIEIYINNEKITFSKDNENKTINLSTLNAEFETIITKINRNGEVKINGKELKNDETQTLGILKLADDNKIDIEVKFFGDKEYTKYQINTIPSDFIKYTVEGQSIKDGDYYITTYYYPDITYYIFKIGNNGELLYYKKTRGISFDFKKTEIEEQVRYTYLEKVNYKKEKGNSAYVPTQLVVMDEKYNEINRISYKLQDNTTMELENHCYLFLKDNNYIVTGYEEIEVVNTPENLKNENGNTRVSNCRIQEIKDGNIVWEFQSINISKFYELCVETSVKFNTTEGDYADYMHINSMVIDPNDQNLVCSFRNIDALIKINRENGEIMWILGGNGDEFNMTEEQKFSRQHSISFTENNEILIYDNGNENEQTRIIKLSVDEESKKLKTYKAYNLDIYSSAMGSVKLIDELNETYLICYGRAEKLEYAIQEKEMLTNKINLSIKFENQNLLYNVNKF